MSDIFKATTPTNLHRYSSPSKLKFESSILRSSSPLNNEAIKRYSPSQKSTSPYNINNFTNLGMDNERLTRENMYISNHNINVTQENQYLSRKLDENEQWNKLNSSKLYAQEKDLNILTKTLDDKNKT